MMGSKWFYVKDRKQNSAGYIHNKEVAAMRREMLNNMSQLMTLIIIIGKSGKCNCVARTLKKIRTSKGNF